MKRKLMTIVKYMKGIYLLYYYVFSFIVNILRFFIKQDNKLILFNSFGGKKYDDSPKEIFEEMKKDQRFLDYRFAWAFHEPQQHLVDGAQIVKTDSLEYFITALKARCWVTNSTIERGLNFKGKKTFYFNTWHGTPIKKMGDDIDTNNKSFKSRAKAAVDIMTVQSDFEATVFSKAFNIPEKKFLKCGLPRNDLLNNCSNEQKLQIREKLNIPVDKKVILYAPTFREYDRDALKNCIFDPPINLSLWEEMLSTTHYVLFRAHYEVAKSMDISNNEFVKDVSEYPCINELILAADILVSDYSSIFFDFAITGKPMFHFTYDYDKYSEKRGMYFDIREYVDGADNEEELIDILSNNNEGDAMQKTKKFRECFVNYYGNAIQTSLTCIAENIM